MLSCMWLVERLGLQGKREYRQGRQLATVTVTVTLHAAHQLDAVERRREYYKGGKILHHVDMTYINITSQHISHIFTT